MTLTGKMSNVFDYLYNEGVLGLKVKLSGDNIVLTDLGSTSKEQKKVTQKTFALPQKIKGALYMDIKNLNYEKHDFRNVRGDMKIDERNLDFNYISFVNSGSSY